MTINLIITAHNKEDFYPDLLKLTAGWKHIIPRICLCYNGANPDFPADIRTDNKGHSRGDMDLTLRGYEHLKANQVFRFLKIGIDTFMLDDLKIESIFTKMEESRAGYGGNYWHPNKKDSFASDIIFADTRFGNVFEDLKHLHADFEGSLFHHVKNKRINWYEIPERVPVHPSNRLECEALHWTMHHSLETNRKNIELWKANPLK